MIDSDKHAIDATACPYCLAEPGEPCIQTQYWSYNLIIGYRPGGFGNKLEKVRIDEKRPAPYTHKARRDRALVALMKEAS